MKLTLNLSSTLQILTWALAILTQGLNANLIPEQWKRGAFIAAGLLSLVLHQAAGVRNPDGSDAALPYAPLVVHDGEYPPHVMPPPDPPKAA